MISNTNIRREDTSKALQVIIRLLVQLELERGKIVWLENAWVVGWHRNLKCSCTKRQRNPDDVK